MVVAAASQISDQFRIRWAAHNVRIHTTGIKRIHHPVVGDLELPFESFPIPGDPSQSMLAYTTEPGSPSGAKYDQLIAMRCGRPATTRSTSPAITLGHPS